MHTRHSETKQALLDIMELINVLKTAFGSRRTILDCYTDLKILQQRRRENICFIDRTSTLHQDIIEAKIHERRCLTNTIISEINSKVSIAFCLGLPCTIQLILKYNNYSLLSELFKETIKATRNYKEKMHRNNKR